ncbi:MAG: alanine racemase [Bacteroidota bacterium]
MLGIPYNIQEIAQSAGAQDLFQGQLHPGKLRYVAYDSRRISHGAETLFVALKTPHRDGHDYVADAYAKGVRNFLVSRRLDLSGVNYALSEDTLLALQTWAMHHRLRFSYPVLAITGSNGKTTIKEWLATLLEPHMQVVKSPRSFNSQLGVPLSLLQLHPQAELAIIEAGISQKGEMEMLREMIQPTLGLLAHMGAAHADGFANETEKLAEKLLLFEQVEKLLFYTDQPDIFRQITATGLPVMSVGRAERADLHLHEEQGQWQLRYGDRAWTLPISGGGSGRQENILLTLLAVHSLGIDLAEVIPHLDTLLPVEMRTELISDHPRITILNDSYNTDPDAVRYAFSVLAELEAQPHKAIILSDIPHLGADQEQVQSTLLQEAIDLAGADKVWTVGPIFASLGHAQAYADTDSLLKAIQPSQFLDHQVLLKGARTFALEQLVPLLQGKPNATFLRINLDALGYNFRQLKGQLAPGVRAMCMVKAAGYGSGTWEIARELERLGADYLAVAYLSEGIDLRQRGIDLPIMIMNPDPGQMGSLLTYDLEPEISSVALLEAYLRAARWQTATRQRIHLKLETGMSRLGLVDDDLPAVQKRLFQAPDLEVVSAMSHLAAADDPGEAAFSRSQIAEFDRLYNKLFLGTGLHPWRHILNTAGLLQFPAAHWEMVRMGIGLYGINPVRDHPLHLQEVGSLISQISQIHQYPAGTSIGYGRAQSTIRDSRIATIPIGYADGIPRSLGEGRISFGIRGAMAPTIGRVCMDMLMLDVTDVPEARAGDPVLIWGEYGDQVLSVDRLALASGTIPYEILVRVSPRVRRIFSKGD